MDVLVFLLRAADAAFLASVVMALSSEVADRLLAYPTLAVRAVTIAIVALALATMSFHVLVALGSFNPIAATLLAVIATFPCRKNAWRSLRRAMRCWGRLLRRVRVRSTEAHNLQVVGFLALCIAIVVRSVLVPPLAWDTLTYHGVKAALWVQGVGEGSLDLHGGWSIYRLYPGGSELLRAWAMLPFHSDFGVALVDVVEWLALGVAVWAVASELRIERRVATLAAMFVMTVPTVTRLVGSAYSDLNVALTLTAGVLFGLRFSRLWRGADLLLAVTSFALAIGVKLSAWPPAGAGIAVLAAAAVYKRRAGHLWWLGAGMLLLAAIGGPWLGANVKVTGYPLSPMPLQVFGVTLGESNVAMSAYINQLHDHRRTLGAELYTLSAVFPWPPAGEALGLPTLPVVLSLPLGVIGVWRKRPFASVFVAALASTVIAGYYNPDFAVVRANWAVSSSRFLIPLVALAAPLVAAFLLQPRLQRCLRWYFASAIVVNVGLTIVTIWGETNRDVALLSIASALLAPLWWNRLHCGIAADRRVVSGAILLLLLGMWWWKDATRYVVAETSITLHPIPANPILAARALDDTRIPHVLAVTAGRTARADNQFLYYFLGKKLQNRLVHIPAPQISSSGALKAWLTALRQRDVDYVVSLAPAARELEWLEGSPQLFERVSGELGAWGIFKIVR